MSSFYYYTDTNSPDLQHDSLDSVITHLETREKIIQAEDYTNPLLKTPIFECLRPEDKYSKYFYDIDAPKGDLPFNENNTALLRETVASCFKIPLEDVISICVSINSPERFSAHITLDYKGGRKEIKDSAVNLGEYIESKFPNFKAEYVDINPYHAHQKFRTVFSAKRYQNRIKVPVIGSIKDSLISVLPQRFLTLQRSTPIYAPTNHNASPKLNWFKAALNTKQLKPLWLLKASNHENRVIIGNSLKKEALGDIPNRMQLARELYVDFGGFGGKLRDHSEERFDTDFNSAIKDQFGLIQKWVKEFNLTIFKTLQPIFNGSVKRIVQEIDFAPTQDDKEDDDISLPDLGFECTTKHEFMLYIHITKSKKLLRYWEIKLSRGDMSPIIAILNSDKAKYTYQDDLLSTKKQLGDIDDSILPYGSIVTTNTNFLEWVGQIFNVEVKEDESIVFSDDLMASVLDNYLDKARLLDPDTHAYYLEFGQQMEKLGLRQESNPANRIKNIIESPVYYRMQLPYKSILCLLFEDCDSDWSTFWKALSHYSKAYLQCEKIFHFLTRSYEDAIASRILLSLYPFWKLSPCGMVYVFDDKTGMWTSDKWIKESIIVRYEAFLEHQTERSTINYALNQTRHNAILQYISFSPEITHEGSSYFIENSKSSFYRLLFKNGYYDGLLEKFIPRTVVTFNNTAYTFFDNCDLMFFSRIDRDYKEDIDEDMFSEMTEKIFYSMHGQEGGNYYMQLLSLFLFGHKFKGFLEVIGDPNSGKSTIVEFNRTSLGGYAGSTEIANFVSNPNESRSAERQNGFVVKTWACRILDSSEKPGGACTKLNNERVKKFSSGRKDTIGGSVLYEKDQIYDIHFILCFYANSPLEFSDLKDTGIPERRNTINCPKTYASEITDPTTQLLKDPTVDDWATNPKRQNIYVQILIRAFVSAQRKGYQLDRPLSETITTQKAITYTTEEYIDQLLQWVVITGDNNDKIPTSSLVDIINTKLGLPNHTKFIMALTSYLEKLGVVTSPGQTRLLAKGKKITIRTGIKERRDQAEDYSPFNDVSSWKTAIEEAGGVITKEIYSLHLEVEKMVKSSDSLTHDQETFLFKHASGTQKDFYQRNNPSASNKKLKF